MENPTFKCKGCGNELNAANAESGVVVCEYCGMARTVPKRETKPAALSYLMLAEHDLDVCAFDNAFTGYKKAAEADGEEPEAYFGMALARFNVQYLKDLTGQKIRLQPICHEVSGKRFCEDANYKKALEKATSAQRAEYERKGKEIDYIRREFEKLEAEGLDYDCFLCVKVTDDETKLRTKDYKRADDIYFNLRKKGYKPFFSERELDDVTGADYEARILYALYSSECMIVVCGNENYLQTPWVKNEYTRFLKLIGDEEKESDSIALAWFSSPIEKLAGKRGKIQGINLDALDASERITAFVENHTPEAKKRREEERARKTQEAEEARRKLEEQERAQRELEERQRLIEERENFLKEEERRIAQKKAEAEYGVAYANLRDEQRRKKPSNPIRRTAIISCSALIVWLVAVVAFTLLRILNPDLDFIWLAFVYAVPVSFVVVLVFACVWKYKWLKVVSISVIIWTTLACVYLTIYASAGLVAYMWLIFLIGVPLQFLTLFFLLWWKKEKFFKV